MTNPAVKAFQAMKFSFSGRHAAAVITPDIKGEGQMPGILQRIGAA
jgi:hypothetical protein